MRCKRGFSQSSSYTDAMEVGVYSSNAWERMQFADGTGQGGYIGDETCEHEYFTLFPSAYLQLLYPNAGAHTSIVNLANEGTCCGCCLHMEVLYPWRMAKQEEWFRVAEQNQDDECQSGCCSCNQEQTRSTGEANGSNHPDSCCCG